MKLQLFVLCLSLLGLTMADGPERLDNYRIYKVKVDNEEQLQQLQLLSKSLPINFLRDVGKVGYPYEIVVDPDSSDALEQNLNFFGINFELIVKNLQDLLGTTWPFKSNSNMEWTKYHSLDDIYQWLNRLVQRHPFTVRPLLVGYSYEGRPIKAIKISRKPGNKAIFIESNIHAIEWISSAVSTYFIDQLLNSDDAVLKQLSWQYDWIFVPVANPDGFVYSHDVERLWRKNRKPTGFHNSSGPCYGTDLNRNFAYAWMENGYNMDVPCDHWYAGSYPSSEPETTALQRFVSSFGNKIRVYIAMHSYGQFLLLPYGHTTEYFPPNYDQMMRISQKFADAARVKYGTDYKYGASALLNYPVSGSAKDWAYGVRNISYTATLELRDRGTYGFFLPPTQIIEVGEEVTDGLKALIAAAKEEKLFD